MSGQAVETYVVLRSCIEYAVYALHINKNPNLTELWLRRHDDGASTRSMRRQFEHVRVIKTLQDTDNTLGIWSAETSSAGNMASEVRAWGLSKGVTGVVWTALAPKLGGTYRQPSVGEVVQSEIPHMARFDTTRGYRSLAVSRCEAVHT
jgi:hypothetical protein